MNSKRALGIIVGLVIGAFSFMTDGFILAQMAAIVGGGGLLYGCFAKDE